MLSLALSFAKGRGSPEKARKKSRAISVLSIQVSHRTEVIKQQLTNLDLEVSPALAPDDELVDRGDLDARNDENEMCSLLLQQSKKKPRDWPQLHPTVAQLNLALCKY